MSDTIPVPVDLLRLAYGTSDELDVWLDEHLPPADQHLEAAIPSEHPRWPDGTPVAIGQRVRFGDGKPGRIGGFRVDDRGAWWVTYATHNGWFLLDRLTRLEPRGDHR